jgi:hypothetical protein
LARWCSDAARAHTVRVLRVVAQAELSGGWLFVTVAISAWMLYIAVGMMQNMFCRGVWAYPHHDFWVRFSAYVVDGATFLARGCKPLDDDSLRGDGGHGRGRGRSGSDGGGAAANGLATHAVARKASRLPH